VAGLYVVGDQATAHPELAAGDTGDHLVPENVRGVGVGLADLRIAVLHAPDDLAGLRIQRDQRGISLLQEDLAVAVREAAIYRIATHHGNDVGFLLRLILPTKGLILEIHRIYVVGKRCMR